MQQTEISTIVIRIVEVANKADNSLGLADVIAQIRRVYSLSEPDVREEIWNLLRSGKLEMTSSHTLKVA